MSETASEQRVTRVNFANRMLTKELNIRMKTTQENKVQPKEEQKFPAPPEEKK